MLQCEILKFEDIVQCQLILINESNVSHAIETTKFDIKTSAYCVIILASRVVALRNVRNGAAWKGNPNVFI